MKFRGLFPLGLTLLVLGACGPAQESQSTGRAESTVPVETTPLRVCLLQEVPGLGALLDAFGTEQGVRIELQFSELADGERPDDTHALREVRSGDLGWLAPSQLVRPWTDPAPLASTLPGLWAAGRFEGQDLGVPWRMEATVLASRGVAQPADWPAFGRALSERGWGLAAPALAVDLFHALLVSTGGALHTEGGEVVLDSPAAIEALSFLTGLAQTSAQPEAVDRFTAGDLGLLVTDLPGVLQLPRGQELATIGVPPLEPAPDGPAWLAVRPTVLVQPAGGPHRDLVAALVLRLQQPDVQELVVGTGRWIPAASAWTPSDPFWARLSGLRTQASYVPPLSGGREAATAIAHAVDQALSRKRSPADALRDAQQAFLTEAVHR